MTLRRPAILLALVLSLSLSGSAIADSPKQAALPSVQSDPVLVLPPVASVQSDPVAVPPLPVSPYTGFVLVTTSGSGLFGTYVGIGPVRYIPAFQYQILSTDPQGGYSCTAYSMAMAIDKATYGGSRITGRQVRALSGVPGYVGMSLPDVLRASAKVYVSFTHRVGDADGDWDDVMYALKHGRGVVLQGDYSAIPDRYSGQLSFKGNHAIFLDHLSSTGMIYMMDPLQKVGARWMPESIIRAFAEKLSRAKGIYPRVFFEATRTTRLFH